MKTKTLGTAKPMHLYLREESKMRAKINAAQLQVSVSEYIHRLIMADAQNKGGDQAAAPNNNN